LTAEAAASIKSVVPRMSMALFDLLLPLIIVLLLSRWDGARVAIDAKKVALWRLRWPQAGAQEAALPVRGGAGPLDSAMAMTLNSPQ
jgi:hypothetical protein